MKNGVYRPQYRQKDKWNNKIYITDYRKLSYCTNPIIIIIGNIIAVWFHSVGHAHERVYLTYLGVFDLRRGKPKRSNAGPRVWLTLGPLNTRAKKLNRYMRLTPMYRCNIENDNIVVVITKCTCRLCVLYHLKHTWVHQ